MQKVIHKDSMRFSGIKTRTNPQNEEKSETSKIKTLWEDFFTKGIDKKLNSPDNNFYGVYYDYDKDKNFNALAGVKLNGAPDDLETVTIPASHYMVFQTKKGPLMQVVGDRWSDIWNFFENNNDYKRTFSGDFEEYPNNLNPNDSQINIYIAVEKI